jgi:hypothetical protein
MAAESWRWRNGGGESLASAINIESINGNRRNGVGVAESQRG